MTILVVDDQPTLSRVTAVALRMIGCQTHTAGSIAEASQLLGVEKIDAVFLDVNLAGESGFEFLSELVARPAPLPVVMFTAHTLDEVIDEARQRGAFDCMVKPFSVDDLRGQIKRLTEHLERGGKPPSQPRV
jgi:DNA-binding NtrC family response regulator